MSESGDFAVSDHTHVENWGTGVRAAAVASTQVYINKWGGPAGSSDGLSNYGFLDGHASSRTFGAVYTDRSRNSFDPTVAH